MHARAVLAILTALFIDGCTTAPTAPPTQPLGPAAADIPAQYARFRGVWSGKWDDVWDVTFVIDDITGDGHANGHYYWKERVPGAWNHHAVAGTIRGATVVFGVITITLDPADGNKAVPLADSSFIRAPQSWPGCLPAPRDSRRYCRAHRHSRRRGAQLSLLDQPWPSARWAKATRVGSSVVRCRG